jgi:hypothetical protein
MCAEYFQNEPKDPAHTKSSSSRAYVARCSSHPGSLPSAFVRFPADLINSRHVPGTVVPSFVRTLHERYQVMI